MNSSHWRCFTELGALDHFPALTKIISLKSKNCFLIHFFFFFPHSQARESCGWMFTTVLQNHCMQCYHADSQNTIRRDKLATKVTGELSPPCLVNTSTLKGKTGSGRCTSLLRKGSSFINTQF